ncbi:transposase [Desulfosarcina widdelii]|uniref:Transposase n=1 Tax=Desulfosarcina widdelii TaxID=947919 RepID=A0A5K7YZ71_9BACT|nr:DDE-type integrase/transposase/recombinase [Desulfosarcina widdelii]BBO74696.1 transposase [Desulfosarcina widdelii]
MDHCLTVNKIAEYLGRSPRMVRMRANRENWPTVYQNVRGGPRQLFLASMLPDDVRCAIHQDPSACTAAGFARGIAVNAERMAAERARREAREAGLAAYNALPQERRDEADARLAILQARDAFLEATRLPKKKGTLLYIKEIKSGTVNMPEDMASAIPRRKGKIALSWSTLCRWEKAYNEQGRAGLAGGYVSKSTTSVPDHMQRFVQGMIIDHPHVSIAMVMQGLEARFDGQTIPSTSAVRRYAKRWKDENASLLLYITNPDEWKNRTMFAFGDMDEQVERLNQLWEYDSTPGDVMLTDGRHTLIGVVDVYSRRAKLLVSPSSKAEAVAALTRRAILDWGVPEIAKTDNGSDYVSRHMVRVFNDLEIRQVLCPPFTPENKPHIERFFKTFSHSIVELLPGYIGHSVADRKAIEARRTFAQRLMKQGSDPVEINLSSEELQTICDRWTRAMYHHNPHSGLDGQTPSQAAREWTGPVRRIGDERALDILLSPAASNGGLREVTKKGVKVDGPYFIAPELAGHEGETVRVLLDRTDFGTIYVFAQDGAYICRAINPEQTGHDRAEIAAKAKAIQKRVIREAAAEAKKLAREAKTRFIAEEILGYRETQIANIVEMPRSTEEYATPMLEEAARAVEDVRRREMGPQPIAITEDEEKRAEAVIQLADKQGRRTLPASDWEKYEFLTQDLVDGNDLTDAELAWMKRYEIFLETGKFEAKS